MKRGKYTHDITDVSDIFGISSVNSNIFFAFESIHSPYQRYILGNIPRTDLVVQNGLTGECLRGLEVKLTALPDNSTCNLLDNQYSSELVVRPDTIVYS